METVTLWNVAAWGWSCMAEQDFGVTSVTTWTRDEQVLVLVWYGMGEVSAAVLDGVAVPLGQVHDLVSTSESADDDIVLLERAEAHAPGAIKGRLGTELAALMAAATRTSFVPNYHVPAPLRSAIRMLALAVLSHPSK